MKPVVHLDPSKFYCEMCWADAVASDPIFYEDSERPPLLDPEGGCDGCGRRPQPEEIVAATTYSYQRRVLANPDSPPVRRERTLPRELPLMMSIPRAARALGKSSSTLRALIAAGHIAVVQDGKRIKIPRTAIERAQAEGLPSADAPRARKRRKAQQGRRKKAVARTTGDAIRALKI